MTHTEYRSFSIPEVVSDGGNQEYVQEFNKINGKHVIRSCFVAPSSSSDPVFAQIYLRHKDANERIYRLIDQGWISHDGNTFQTSLSGEDIPVPSDVDCELVALAYNNTGEDERLVFSGVYEVIYDE